MILEYKEITKEELKNYRELILPMVYEELEAQEDISTEYICIAAVLDDEPVGAIVADLEGNGDINLLSIWTDQEYRRYGIASALREKMTEVAVNLYDWEEDQFGDDIDLRTMYCLKNGYREDFEAWLRANDFTDFCILRPSEGDKPQICSAISEVHFYRTMPE